MADYLIRLDDACVGMDAEKWARCEMWLDQLSLAPVVACVPDCKDPDLIKRNGMGRTLFWEKVRSWHEKGWEIALHGFQHKLHSIALQDQVLPLNELSEFVGLPFDEQRAKLKRAIQIFHDNGLTPRTFIAPAHSLDRTTYEAIKTFPQIQIISDGFYLYPYRSHELLHIPQQLWTFRRAPFGVWTICLHPTSMSLIEIDRFFEGLRGNHRVMNFSEVIAKWTSKRPLLNIDLFQMRKLFKKLSR